MYCIRDAYSCFRLAMFRLAMYMPLYAYMYACVSIYVCLCMRQCMGGCFHRYLQCVPHGWIHAYTHTFMHTYIDRYIHTYPQHKYQDQEGHVCCGTSITQLSLTYIHTYRTQIPRSRTSCLLQCSARRLWLENHRLAILLCRRKIQTKLRPVWTSAQRQC
jgi:hypothetical protein